MAQYDNQLDRIASALERTPETPFLQTTLGQVALLLLGALLGYVLSRHVRKAVKRWEIEQSEQAELRQRARQRQLLTSLLGDEIALRWNGLIAKDFRELFEECSKAQGQARTESWEALCRTRFQKQDLFVFVECARNLSLTTVFDDNAVVSHLIYVHLVAGDFVDGCETFRSEYNKPKRDSSRKADHWFQEHCERLAKKFEELDRTVLAVYARIENEYVSYVREGGFTEAGDYDVDQMRRKISEIAKKRLPERAVADPV